MINCACVYCHISIKVIRIRGKVRLIIGGYTLVKQVSQNILLACNHTR